ncbi:MAG: bifunctional (p)ppGpp synthetase/guanosine-3',5'-bis(diphosphate) 3'-pyrophosphohydrolase [Ghiorsea sp.]|nr:bifunctional (p)ppGpp synthetase/guanosine-3',5'-bis(diphosphate) 3'-pyrophosphohydrolase [Ghiorsea sp.]
MIRIFEITEQVLTYMPKADIELINRAYVFAAHAHARQRRSTGELYITHPLAVAKNLVELRMDVSTIVTGLLHDTVEDTHVTLEDIKSRFGDEIAKLVDGVTKVGKIHFRSSEHQKAGNFRKMIMATAQDLRVLLVKLADRLHNMNTLSVMRPDKQKRIAIETMEIYVPLAHRLGIHWIAQDMEDLAFRYIDPDACQELEQKLEGKIDFLRQTQLRLEGIIQEALSRQGLEAKVQGRMKNMFSLHQKMQRKSLDFDEIYDFMAFRVIVEDTPACYHVLGMIHSLYHPVPGRFKDYIALPKANGYQSLHTAVIGPDNFRIEVQIRSESMHRYAEDGVASHWLYKSEGSPEEQQEVQGFQWLKQLAETLHTADNPGEFLENVRLDLFVKEVYVFSRDGDLFALPRGSKPLDFAYAVHTDIGNHCLGVRINGAPAAFQQNLHNGDEIEVLTSPEQTPSRKWLQWVKTAKAKQSIRQWFRLQEKDSAVRLGEHLLNSVLGKQSIQHDMLRFAKCNDDVELKEKLGRGDLDISTLVHYLHEGDASVVRNKAFVESRMNPASCCHPIPGDNVVGAFIVGEGFIVHSYQCPEVMKQDDNAWVVADWKPVDGHLYKTGIEVFCSNERGSLGRVGACLSQAGVNIEDLRLEQLPGTLTLLNMLVDVEDRVHLARVFKALKGLDHVSRVRRRYPQVVKSHLMKYRLKSVLKSVAYFGKTLAHPFKKKMKNKRKAQGK